MKCKGQAMGFTSHRPQELRVVFLSGLCGACPSQSRPGVCGLINHPLRQRARIRSLGSVNELLDNLIWKRNFHSLFSCLWQDSPGLECCLAPSYPNRSKLFTKEPTLQRQGRRLDFCCPAPRVPREGSALPNSFREAGNTAEGWPCTGMWAS